MSIAHNTWNLLPKKRPADIIINDILQEDQSLYEDAGEYVKEGAEDLVDDLADEAGNLLKKLLEKIIVPTVEIGSILLLGLIIVENVI